MATPTQVRRGVVHAKTIELDEETGLPDGQRVRVMVQHSSHPASGTTG